MAQVRDFASGYARSHRIYESTGIALGLGSIANLGVHLALADKVSGWWLPLTVFTGLLGADFTSGVVHWLFDTWGSTDTPVVGQLAIRTFREHHVDARAMTRHGFVETNGHNIGLSIVPSLAGYFAIEHHTLGHALVAMSCFFMSLCVAMTSQIHKWAHAYESAPAVVRWLQDAGLIIGAKHHNRHHVRPHDSHYCITVGWMNGPLEWFHFFPAVERLITVITGVPPRIEDLEATAGLVQATELIVSDPVEPVTLPADVAAPADVL